MTTLIQRLTLGLLLAALFGLPTAAQAALDPLGLLLGWQRDPTTSMTIDWHVAKAGDTAGVAYRPVEGEQAWTEVAGEQQPFPFSDRFINRVELTGLEPDTEYLFRVGEFERVRRFRTMPAENISRPVRLALGGDVRGNEAAHRVSRQAMRMDPDFVVWGGDLAYANGDERHVGRWHELLDMVMREMVTPDGRTVPVLMGIGNHEVRGGYYTNNDHDLRKDLPPYTQSDDSRLQIAPYYYRLAAFPGQPGYGALDFGNYLSLILLDTDHTNPIDGEQTRWLQQALASRVGRVAHIFPIYHVGAWPSARHWDGGVHRRVREHWVPLFEQSRLPMVFEHHDHTYKRSWPIRNGRIDPRGVVYMGDGAWGVGVRDIGRSHRDENAWYLDRVASQSHAIIVTLQGSYQNLTVVSEQGHIIDEYPRMQLRDGLLPEARRWSPSELVE